MKTWVAIVLTLLLSACAPEGGVKSDVPKTGEETPSPENPKQPKIGGPIVNAPSDCGLEVMKTCNLFGLTPDELMSLRKKIPDMNPPQKAKGESPSTLAMKRTLYVSQVLRERFPGIDLNINKLNMNDFAEYHASFKWSL